MVWTSSTARQLFRGPTRPDGLPPAIVAGLSSTNANEQQAAIEQLRGFVHELFFLDVNKFFLITNPITAGIICLLIVIGIPVILHRLYHKRLDLFRLERRAQGSYIVPNAINCFLLLEGLYGVLTVAFNFVVWKLFHDEMAVWVKFFPAFRSLIWIPLYIGAFLTGWGSFYTAPGALDKPSAARNKTSAKGRLPWPLIVNLSCLGTPVALIISLLPPVCLSSVKMVDAFNMYKAWDARVQALVAATAPGALVAPTAVQATSAQAYDIFYTWTRSYYFVDISYVLWAFWALLFLFFYVPAGGTLVFLLFRQVRKQKAILVSYQRKIEVQLAHEEKNATVLTGDALTAPSAPRSAGWNASGANSRGRGAALEDIYEDRGASGGSEATGHSGVTASFKGSHEMVGIDSMLRQEPPRVHGALTPGLNSRLGQVASLADEAHGESNLTAAETTPPVSPRSPSMLRRLISATSSTHKLGTSTHKRARRVSITGGPMSRYKYLRRCLVNLLILYLGIISAACFFGAVTIYLAAVEYEHALQGPEAVAESIAIAGATAAWVSAVFGVLTIGSIIFRNFDNPQPEASQGSGGDGALRKRFHRNASRTLESGEAQGGVGRGAHDKTRTLPAVPESVDIEASMVSRSRPHMAHDMSMKFAMGEGHGGFVMRPDDQLASAMSVGNTPEIEVAPSGGRAQGQQGAALRPPGPPARAWLGREREATMSIPQDVTESFGLYSLPMLTRPGEAAPVDAVEGHETVADSTLREYPSFDPQLMRSVDQETTLDTAPISPRDTSYRKPVSRGGSPVLKRHARLPDSVGSETPASRIAREWAQSQYLATPLPEPPARGDAAGWVDDMDSAPLSPPVSPPSSPPRPKRDHRRLL